MLSSSFGDWRLHQRADPPQRHRPTSRRAADNDDWQKVGHHVPLIVNLQPAGEYLGEDYHHAGGVPAVVAELMQANLLPYPAARTVNGKSIGDNCKDVENLDPKVIRPVRDPLKKDAGFINLKGSLFDTAIMKTSVISEEFRKRYLSNPKDPEAFEGKAMVFDGPRIIMPASMILRSALTSIRSSSCAAPARWVIPAAPRW
jgi:dihydroxyacid dehydratase/phosphogluconate dehydratase